MPKMFGLPEMVKGRFCYDYYTMELYYGNIGNIDDAVTFIPGYTRE
jgi:hypothetical protein